MSTSHMNKKKMRFCPSVTLAKKF